MSKMSPLYWLCNTLGDNNKNQGIHMVSYISDYKSRDSSTAKKQDKQPNSSKVVEFSIVSKGRERAKANVLKAAARLKW
ncbi:hypothetical protein [Shewanella sp. GXUN23E]|uniref:hypothetical protein n=1 Tax=Shewanella sp. GXUN23E TaxID=3422498 RepID=UPI003D7DC513